MLPLSIAKVLLTAHILFVSETFERHGLPRNLVIASAATILTLWLWIRLRGALMRHHGYTVERIAPAGENAYSIDLRSETGRPLDYLPGQFAFLSLASRALSREPHPFTISSSPSRSETLQFTIRGSGDWTRRIKNLQVGEKAAIHGFFGHFSHLFVPGHREIIMIAGGIGISGGTVEEDMRVGLPIVEVLGRMETCSSGIREVLPEGLTLEQCVGRLETILPQALSQSGGN